MSQSTNDAGRTMSTMALVTLIAGVGGFTFLPFFGSIIALVTGPMAEKQIRKTGEDGARLARIGKIFGWVGLAMWTFLALAVLLILVVAANR